MVRDRDRLQLRRLVIEAARLELVNYSPDFILIFFPFDSKDYLFRLRIRIISLNFYRQISKFQITNIKKYIDRVILLGLLSSL